MLVSFDSSWDLVGLWHHMGIPARGVIILLFLISASAGTFVVERVLKYVRSHN
jgi:hypothetical protein